MKKGMNGQKDQLKQQAMKKLILVMLLLGATYATTQAQHRGRGHGHDRCQEESSKVLLAHLSPNPTTAWLAHVVANRRTN